MPLSADNLKQVMRHWASGVAIITSTSAGSYHGLTANSFTSISTNPVLISVAINNHTRSYQMISDAGFFGVSILSEGQQAVSDRFAGKEFLSNRFVDLDVFYLITGAPLIKGALAHLDCRITYAYEMPDSTLFIGEVVAAQISDSLKPLIYYDRGYHKL
ncbi:MAG: flavin reductase family protein [Anaerolineae bacterium]|nr:flavin reductase family protein [Anaerolineae bacterium]